MKPANLPSSVTNTYALLDGRKLSLDGLSPRESKFLRELLRMARNEEDYFEIYAKACGPGSVALRGASSLTRALAETPLYLVARDLATRAGIHQQLILAPEYESLRVLAPTDGSTVSVTQAAEILGISRTAVHKAIKAGKIIARRIGNALLAERQSVLAYTHRPQRTRSSSRSPRQEHGTASHGAPVTAKGKS